MKKKPDDNLVLLRFTGGNGRRLAALCRPEDGRDVLREIVDDGCAFAESEDEEGAIVAIATDGLVTIRNSEDLTMLAWWLSLAAAWLKTREE